ncbi:MULTISPECIES: MarR family winged helix-turn-helix transcriptional regulator [Streptomyces]|jgi:DNA-binding MarR family transcriptional regulator|uniref:MarR family transcriptional regulator n=1 Tax=Streptomyces olivaceus TaxID=47716 RepID=A0ABS7WEI3_STROV|nr:MULTISPECIES: MarR family transcriptional regulator [Streptomyces]AOW85224.1 MarR family transcriptional regulator [Streptomyces olivaceus]MBZ6085969.1 MarR family transcriptional regulator [Streptomyces olivaceus]MBZ6093075.1 MarR family transcriptional regulator [Streptomyces olivaceus]MBZ6100114.1 MarR family transcriptional regulator [Streptomyces olivaceus]MBZ6105351.1 MarR family transcriptional regulator [Streptomyces olivaceus]
MTERTPVPPPHPAQDVTEHVGYRLKRTAAALRGAMDRALREHGLTVPQYSCLELLDERPGLSNADLARGTFVTRQSANVVLRGLGDAGLITRPATADHGRALPAHLTPAGRERLHAARGAVYAVEARMITGVPADRLPALLADLDAMTEALGD